MKSRHSIEILQELGQSNVNLLQKIETRRNEKCCY